MNSAAVFPLIAITIDKEKHWSIFYRRIERHSFNSFTSRRMQLEKCRKLLRGVIIFQEASRRDVNRRLHSRPLNRDYVSVGSSLHGQEALFSTETIFARSLDRLHHRFPSRQLSELSLNITLNVTTLHRYTRAIKALSNGSFKLAFI